MLRKDHRWQMLESLSKEEKENLFNTHIDQLNQKKRDQFRKLLDEQTEVSVKFPSVREGIMERGSRSYLKTKHCFLRKI